MIFFSEACWHALRASNGWHGFWFMLPQQYIKTEQCKGSTNGTGTTDMECGY